MESAVRLTDHTALDMDMFVRCMNESAVLAKLDEEGVLWSNLNSGYP